MLQVIDCVSSCGVYHRWLLLVEGATGVYKPFPSTAGCRAFLCLQRTVENWTVGWENNEMDNDEYSYISMRLSRLQLSRFLAYNTYSKSRFLEPVRTCLLHKKKMKIRFQYWATGPFTWMEMKTDYQKYHSPGLIVCTRLVRLLD